MKYLFLCLAIYTFTGLQAQKNSKKAGPIIKEFGEVFQVENPDLQLATNKQYNVIFDVYTDKTEGKSVNPLINTVARFLNMHGQQDVPAKNINVVLVLHGAAAKSSLDDATNSNLPLLKALNEANVTIFVCGQSLKARKLDRAKVSKHIKVSLSALTALVEYQSKGYQLINFN